jgi:Mitochondrial ribosome protein 63
MRLTLINFFGGQRIPGHLFRGKKRLVEIVTRKSMNQQIREFELAEANMLLLRHPFLTLVRTLVNQCHAKANKQTL